LHDTSSEVHKSSRNLDF